MRQPSLSSHPLFAAKARGLRNRVLRFTPSWFIVTMVSAGLGSWNQWNSLHLDKERLGGAGGGDRGRDEDAFMLIRTGASAGILLALWCGIEEGVASASPRTS